jgi:7,8-dihydropterin-6-yl-methyl-4-(beta-D-ribofuranosyl)aminobenzene 5'-phosphate synthase
MSIVLLIVLILAAVILALFLALCARFYLGRRRADKVWKDSDFPKLTDIGTVDRLSILPLCDRLTSRDDLKGEPGVSYLIRADDRTILFDVGFNQKGEHPSPLLHNMAALDVKLDDVDCIVISHLHADHVGGLGFQRGHTFEISKEPIDLKGKTAYVPERMTHSTARILMVNKPRVLAPGVASLGPIPRQMFFFGWTPEQPLAVNVKDKGIVLISGCGHPMLSRIIERAEMLFDEPIYGIIGGLHYPVTESGAVVLGIPMQKILGTGKWPWDPINKDDVDDNIAYLKRRDLEMVSLSPHDSCDWSIEAFRKAFVEKYTELLVGQEITIG